MRVVAALRALLIALAVATTSLAAPAAAYADHRSSFAVDIGFFYDDLSPYGDWYDSPQYGWVFAPRVSSGWRPYTVGHWVWTDEYGWLWVSDENFGWATFHYGRWYHEPAFGWAWVPGYDWGPSWCSFRYGGGYTGWAPLPPRAGWSAGIGLQIGGVNIDAFIQPDYYTFVPVQSFVNTGPLYRYAVPVAQNQAIIRATNNVTSYSAAQGRVVNRSLRLDTVEKAAGRPVPRARPVEVDSVKVARNARVKDNEVAVFKPAVREAKAKAPSKGKPLPKREAASDDRPDRERGDRGTTVQDEKQKRDEQRAVDRRADDARRESDRRRDLDSKQQVEQQARAKADRENDMAEQKALARRRAEEAKAQTDSDRQREADQRAAEQRRADENRAQAAREKDMAEQKALARRRAEEAKAQADHQREQEADRRAAEQRRADENRAQAAREKDMAEQKALARRRVEEAKAQADRQREQEADRRAAEQRAAEQKDREMRQAREQQERERGLADQRQRDARREPPQVHTPEKQRATEVTRDKRSPAPPAKKSREKEKDKDKDREKPPNR